MIFKVRRRRKFNQLIKIGFSAGETQYVTRSVVNACMHANSNLKFTIYV
jgi:hypothetical protein